MSNHNLTHIPRLRAALHLSVAVVAISINTNLVAAENYVRLTVTAPNTHLEDSGNVLGQLPDSVMGYDTHDLLEMPPPWQPYLTLVFPHPEWTAPNSGNYASDFHPVNTNADTWKFAVLTDDPHRTVTLSWSGNSTWINHSDLLDQDLATTTDTASHQFYTFNMNGTKQRNFIWNLYINP